MSKKKVAVTFPILSTYGGAEIVCIDICKFLSYKYEVELICYKTEINKYLEINESFKVKKIRSQNFIINYICSKFIICAQVFIINFLNKNEKKYDFVFSSSGEIISKLKTIQLVHHPFFSTNIYHYLALGIARIQVLKILLRFSLTNILKILFKINNKEISKNFTIANSKWSQKRFHDVYGNSGKSDYLYLTYLLDNPVIQTFIDYEKRNNNFVILGRVTKDKRIEEGIKVFIKLQVFSKSKLYIIGSGDNKYITMLKNKYCDHKNIIFTGFITQEKKVEILENSKYGLHLFRYEHFGMAPCEMQNYGMIVFVYNDGGVAEIVSSKDQKFNNQNDLFNKAKKMIIDKDHRNSTHNNMKNMQNFFLKDNFYTKLNKIIMQNYE